VKRSFDVLVAGGGIAGLSVALLLARSQYAERMRITLADAGPRPSFDMSSPIDLRVSAVSAGSADIFTGVGAWSAVQAARCCPFDHMRVWDAGGNPDGAATLAFDADEFAVPHLGYIVENRLLQHVLLDALDTGDTEIHFGTCITDFAADPDRPQVGFDGAAMRAFDLVIAADGGDSPLRHMASLPVHEHAYRQDAFVTHLATEIPHANTAWQRFLPAGPLGMLPLHDGRVSVVWTTAPESAADAMAMDDAELADSLTAASDGVLGTLRVAGPRGRFPLVARHARDYVRHGFALLGDAAHTVHPLAGQGANLGIADAAGLVRVIDAAFSRGEHPADVHVLRRYERARKGENALMMHFMTGLNRLFASDSAIIGELRRTGMALFNRSGPIRGTMAGIALGSAMGK
jgi:2-polyprenylphenol 6-hydroxylase